MNVSDFLKRVWGTETGWAFIAYASGGDFDNARPYRYPKDLDTIVEEIKDLNTWADVYFCPHLFSQPLRRKEYALKPKCLWLDKDSGKQTEITPQPSILWQTSEGKYQALWMLKEHIDPYEAELVTRELTYISKGDKGTWNLGRLLRVPGTYNYKYSPPQEGFVIWEDGAEYELSDIVGKYIKEIKEEKMEKEAEKLSLPPKELKSVEKILIEYGTKIPTPIWEMLRASPTEDDDWSEALWKLERTLLEAGLPLEDVYVLAKESPWNKYRRTGRSDIKLWQELVKAYLKKPIVEEVKGKEKKFQWIGLPGLMAYSKRPEWLVEDIWMERNVGFIAGTGKAFKSTVSLDLALSIASGEPFLNNFKVANTGPVMMVQEEDPLWRVSHRVQVMASRKGIASADMEVVEDGLKFEIYPLRDIPFYLSVGTGFLFKDIDLVSELEKSIDSVRPKLLILDPLFMMMAGMDEYKAGDITEMLNLLKKWRNKYGCAICVIHHYNKPSRDGRDERDRLYGSSAMYWWSENTLFMSRAHGQETVSISRDLKDATLPAPIAVTFQDLTEDYLIDVDTEGGIGDISFEEDFRARGKIDHRKPVYNKLVTYLKELPMGSACTKSELMLALEATDKPLKTAIDTLRKESKVFVESKGKGGKVIVTTREKLYEETID